jgi:hypothetical protein
VQHADKAIDRNVGMPDAEQIKPSHCQASKHIGLAYSWHTAFAPWCPAGGRGTFAIHRTITHRNRAVLHGCVRLH